jgi:phenylalanyl-tRNA synthetase beta chain
MQYYSGDVQLLPEAGVDELVRQIGAQLGEVESVTDLGAMYNGVVVAKVISCDKHPDADKLQVCKIDDAGKTPDIARDEQGHVQVVCGAPNVREGLLVAWLPPGATVPATYNKDPFVLEAREIRGQISNGMLASAHELALSDDHDGILELEDGQPGDDLATVLKLNDHIIDIENKMFTHRPDCFGQLGVAREIAGIQHKAFHSPDWYLNPTAPTPQNTSQKIEVKNGAGELVPRFMAVAMSGLTVGSSPLWLQSYLTRVGIRPINNVVDLTNYYMMLTGQPMHAYDADKLPAMSLETRLSKNGDKLKLLNGKEITIQNDSTILITSNDTPVGIGGVMGGADTEVSQQTTNIVLECATFDLYAIRRTSMELGLFTDAVTRYNKGQSPLQNDRVLYKIMQDMTQFAGAQQSSEVVDIKQGDFQHQPVLVTAPFINERLGLRLSADEMATLLTNVEFAVQVSGEELSLTTPFWRTDIEIAEDVVEEVGRLYGYDHLPQELPQRSITPAPRNELLQFKARIRQLLSSAGANEVLTYSFVHGNLLDKVGQDKDLAYQLTNALSPDLQYYRLSLTPSLLDKVHANIKAGHDQFALFEMSKAHAKNIMDDENVPREFHRVALVFAANPKAANQYAGAPYYQARKYLDTLLEAFGAQQAVTLKPLADVELPPDHFLIQQMTQPFDSARTAVLMQGDLVVGVVGEYRQAVANALKLPNFCAGFETFHSFLLKGAGKPYEPLSKFPEVQQDISLKVAADTNYQSVLSELKAGLTEQIDEHTQARLTPLDIYQKDDARHLTFRLHITRHDKTMVNTEVNQLLDQLAQRTKEKLGTERL